MKNIKKMICCMVACLFLSVTFGTTAQADITQGSHQLNEVVVTGHRRNSGSGVSAGAIIGGIVGGVISGLSGGSSGGSGGGGAVFDTLAERTGSFAQGFRNLAMVLSGFGIIMFTFLAICGKINFKHLGYIFISLFFLSGVGALIVYIADVPENLVFINRFDTVDQAVTSEGHSSSL